MRPGDRTKKNCKWFKMAAEFKMADKQVRLILIIVVATNASNKTYQIVKILLRRLKKTLITNSRWPLVAILDYFENRWLYFYISKVTSLHMFYD